MKYYVKCYQLKNVNRLMNIKNSKELFGYYNAFNSGNRKDNEKLKKQFLHQIELLNLQWNIIIIIMKNMIIQIFYMKKMFYVLLNNGKIKLKRIQELEVNQNIINLF